MARCATAFGGLRDSYSQRKLLTKDQLTLTRSTAIAQSMEAATRQSTQMCDVLTDLPKGVGKLTMGQSNSHVLARGSGSKSARNGMNGKRNAGGSAGKSDRCYRCTKRGHLPQDCKWKDASCHKYHKRGHISPACRAPQKPNVTKYVESSSAHSNTEKEDLQLFTIPCGGRDGSLMMSVQIVGVGIEMEIDTGAAVSLTFETSWKERLPHVKLEPSKQRLSTYTGERIRVMGEAIVPLRCNGQTAQVPIVVVLGKETPLFGRNWLDVIRLDWPGIKCMQKST